MRIRLNLPDPLAARVGAFAARAGLDLPTAYVFLLVDALRHDAAPPFRELLSQALEEAAAEAGPAMASHGHAAPVVRATSPVLPEPPADVAAALRMALARLTRGSGDGAVVRRIAAQNVVDEAGLAGDAAWREATRALHDAGWRQGPDDGDVWTVG